MKYHQHRSDEKKKHSTQNPTPPPPLILTSQAGLNQPKPYARPSQTLTAEFLAVCAYKKYYAVDPPSPPKIGANGKTTAPRIPAWSPTVVLTRRHTG